MAAKRRRRSIPAARFALGWSDPLLTLGPHVIGVWSLLMATADRHGASEAGVAFFESFLRISAEEVRAALDQLVELRRAVKWDNPYAYQLVSREEAESIGGKP